MEPLFNALCCVIGFETDSDLFAYSLVSKFLLASSTLTY